MRKFTSSQLSQHIRNIDIYGYTVIENCLDSKLIKTLHERLEELYDQDKLYSGKPERDKFDKYIYNLQNKDKDFIDILSYEPLERILISKLNDEFYRYLPKDKPNYILSYYNARSSGEKLDLHIDSNVPSPGNYTWAMQAVFVIEGMSRANGGTVVVPGSHLSGKYTDRSLENLVHLEAKPGDIIIWDSRLWHGTSENKIKKSRWALIATFTCWWVKQSMDITRSLPNNIYNQLSDKQKALLGYCSIPPFDENERINTKTSYESLKANVEDYFK